MKPRKDIIQFLFEVVKCDTPIPEKKLSDIKFLIKTIPKLATNRKQEIAIYQEIPQSNPEIKIECPEEISINVQDENGFTMLIWAAFQDHREFAHELIFDAKANPNIQTKEGDTALTLAAEYGHAEIAHDLIFESKANADLQNKNGDTALIRASLKGQQKIAHQLIVDAKANLNIKNVEGSTALIYAVMVNYIEIALVLIKAKAALDIANNSGRTALIWAAKNGNKKIADKLIQAKAALDLQDENGDTALICAVTGYYVEIALGLIKAKASLDIRRENGDTALILAACRGQKEIAHELIEAKADPNIQGRYGDTALNWAAYEGHREIARALIEAGAKLELVSQNGNTPLDDAIRTQKLSTISLLLSHGAMLRHPQKLFDFLQSLDNQGNPDVLISLKCLCEQLKKRLVVPAEEKKSEFKADLLKKVEDYLGKLEKLTDIHHKQFENTLYNATPKSIPKDLVCLMAEFDAPLERLRFFKPAEIDTLLPSQEEQKQDKLIEKQQNKSEDVLRPSDSSCFIM